MGGWVGVSEFISPGPPHRRRHHHLHHSPTPATQYYLALTYLDITVDDTACVKIVEAVQDLPSVGAGVAEFQVAVLGQDGRDTATTHIFQEHVEMPVVHHVAPKVLDDVRVSHGLEQLNLPLQRFHHLGSTVARARAACVGTGACAGAAHSTTTNPS